MLAVDVAVQLRGDPRERRTWPVYQAVLRARLSCAVRIVVVTGGRTRAAHRPWRRRGLWPYASRSVASSSFHRQHRLGRHAGLPGAGRSGRRRSVTSLRHPRCDAAK